jgi:hypothetical protein
MNEFGIQDIVHIVSQENPEQSAYERLLHAPRTTLNQLIEEGVEDRGDQNIGDARLYPYKIENPDRNRYYAVVDYPLNGLNLLKFLHSIAPYKRDLLNYSHLGAVVADWKEIKTPDKNEKRSKYLDKIHENIPGFSEFAQHLPDFIGASFTDTIPSERNPAGKARPIVPVIQWEELIDPTTGVPWHNTLCTDKIPAHIQKGLASGSNLNGAPSQDCSLNPFAGMMLVPYIYDNITNPWPGVETVKYRIEDRTYSINQEIGPAQVPVKCWQEHHSFFDYPLLPALQEYIDSNVDYK